MIEKCGVADAEQPCTEFIRLGERLAGKISFYIRFLSHIVSELAVTSAESHQKTAERFLTGLYISYKLLARHRLLILVSVVNLLTGDKIGDQITETDCKGNRRNKINRKL